MTTPARQPSRSRVVQGTIADAPESLRSGRAMARAWAAQVDDRKRQAAAWAFTAEAIRSYALAHGESLGEPLQISPLRLAMTYELDSSAAEVARTLGRAAATLPVLQACYQLSAAYTAMLPDSLRSTWGAYYTPPALTDRLLDLAEEAGADWSSARVLDPACGGGAFLLPVALRMQDALKDLDAGALLEHLAGHLRGFEIDPFAAWLTQVWLEVTFADITREARRPFPVVVTVGDSLEQEEKAERLFDVVVGNPPYGRLSLPPRLRQRYKRSLFGHANLYGLFTDLGLRRLNPGGVLAYVTPTSFLAGEYFKALRSLLAREAAPVAIDFVTARRGVFEDVLQEALLATYRRGGAGRQVTVHYLDVRDGADFKVVKAGGFELPTLATDPWLAPREPGQQALATRLSQMDTRLSDWGYCVSTGPLVWNRFKPQLRTKAGKGCYPLIWAEAVTSKGEFIFRAEKRGHQPYFHAGLGDDWLKVTTPCVLLQRTTAKEQLRRLIAAELPEAFIRNHGAVIVENHLNMIRPFRAKPKVSPAAVAAYFNSAAADQSFRCISGSVAVSAFELEALPLPSVAAMKRLENLLRKAAPAAAIEAACAQILAKDDVA